MAEPSARDLELYRDIVTSQCYVSKGPYYRAMDVLEGALRVYGLDTLVMSFNGGKDATVLLHLVRAAGFLSEGGGGVRRSDGKADLPIKCAYFVDNKSFPEIDEFVVDMEKEHFLFVERFEGGYKDGCQHMMNKFGASAFFLGTRKSDPHGQFVESFSPSTKGWPAFMRVHPILSWNYQDVWRFLVEFRLPYCKLYDMGYTSLGSRFDTEKNPALLRPDGTYRPAHSLVLSEDEADLERNGRGAETAELPSPSSKKAPCEIGLITVGDEVLSAKVMDVNTGYACRELRKLGIVPKRAVILPDDLEEISRFVKEMSRSYSAVITMGGIGPTHDDMTLKGVAKGLDIHMTHSIEMEHFLHSITRSIGTEQSGQEEFKISTQKMCVMPQGTELLMEDGKEYPLLRCQNVYMLPGVPSFMRQQLAHVGRILGCRDCFLSRKIGYSVDESIIAEAVAETARQYPVLSVGCYPFYGQFPERGARTVIVIEGKEEAEVLVAVGSLLSRTPSKYVLFNIEGSSLAGEFEEDLKRLPS